jgi:adenine-specific DNA-methyltransferase
MTNRLDSKVELTWTNKDLRLITLDDPAAKPPYEWVATSDFRAAETRLFTEVVRVGDPTAPNLLIRGDALHALTALSKEGSGVPDLTHKVRLAYLDPPFNTGQAFDAYEDNLEKSIWLTMMRDRLRQIETLLDPMGSVWVHCDDSMGAHLRIVMDEVFGEAAFVATIVWQKRTTRENRKAIGSGHDYIHVFAPAGKAAWARVRNMLDSSGEGYANPDNHPRGPWRSVPMSAQAGHATESQFYEITTPTGVVLGPPKGRAWTYTHDRFLELVAAGRVYFPKGGDGRPRLRRFPDEDEGLVPMSWWPASEVGDNAEGKNEVLALFPDEDPFDTPKPERLMRRIIEIATNQGDWVLDCFAGSASTAAVAHKLGRRWITVEIVRTNVDRYDMTRLTKVVEGTDAGGITGAVGWEGGGGFALVEMAPSMFEVEDGIADGKAKWEVTA